MLSGLANGSGPVRLGHLLVVLGREWPICGIHGFLSTKYGVYLVDPAFRRRYIEGAPVRHAGCRSVAFYQVLRARFRGGSFSGEVRFAQAQAGPASGVQVVLRPDGDPSLRRRDCGGGGPERVRQIQHLGRGDVGAGGAVCEEPARRQDGGRHLCRDAGPQADGDGGGVADAGGP